MRFTLEPGHKSGKEIKSCGCLQKAYSRKMKQKVQRVKTQVTSNKDANSSRRNE